jgi:hypothetical protein
VARPVTPKDTPAAEQLVQAVLDIERELDEMFEDEAESEDVWLPESRWQALVALAKKAVGK